MRQTTTAASQGDAASHTGGVMTSPLHGGKTAPRFLQDLNQYNPNRLPPNYYNILTELALPYEGTQLPSTTARGSCQHRWALKINQSTLPELDIRPDFSSVYTAASYCTQCRCHLDLSIDYRGEGPGLLPCPKEGAPLHHFMHSPNASDPLHVVQDGPESGAWIDVQVFHCSSPFCSARLVTRLRSPWLKSGWVNLLVDPAAINTRARKVMENDPVRFEGHAVPTPITVLTNLRAYITNALSNPEPRRIVGNNKKWLLSLGDPCVDIVEFLGFERDGDDWMPPRPDVPAVTPYTSPLNIILDDVDKELVVLLESRSEEEKHMAKVYISSMSAALDFQRMLGCNGYKRSAASRTIDLTKDDEHPFYAGLGATGDFHDDLICFAYDRQVECDPANASYYLECLQGIASGRKSEDLHTKAAVEASTGKISLQDVRDAYRSFGLDFRSEYLDDESIIGTFQARVADAPKQEPELRRALRIIGQNRSSTKIQQVASNEVTTYEQALAWLSAPEEIDDAFLITLYGVKVGENQANEEISRKAIALIAEKRNSSALKTWVETGHLGDVEMDIGQAYARLGIDDRTVEDDLIITTYNLRASDTPAQIDDLKRALTTIAKTKESQFLLNFLNSGMVTSEHMLAEWPVGLENIGNTCYLNSLLQFYFTVKPLRDLVLDFDQHKTLPEEESFNKKRVGSRGVSKKEIERAQRFVYELQKLFRSMIIASKAQVVPEQELARLTLISSSTEEHIRRQSVFGMNRPSLGEIHGNPIQGPLPPPIPQVMKDDVEMTNDTTSSGVRLNEEAITHNIGDSAESDTSSEGTLVEAPAAEVQEENDFMMIDSVNKQQQILDDKENLPPFKEDLARPSTPESNLIPLGESSPSRANEQQRTLEPTTNHVREQQDSEMNENGPLIANGPPSRAPPPIPPRKKPEEQKMGIQEEVEIGAQQDVTEVIANVLFQLQCAIKAESTDESGEQIDQVKKLFFGKQKSYTTNERGIIRTKEEFISDIKVDVASGPRDIYAALDGAFDVQEVEVGGSLEPQYTTLSQIPPVLQIMVQRVQFDPEKKTTFKSNHHLELKETIYMDRYMDSSDADLQQRRQECWRWKTELAALEARKVQLTQTELGIQMPEVLIHTSEYLKQFLIEEDDDDPDPVEVKPELIENLAQVASDANQELSSLDNQIRTLTTSITTQFADLRALPYRLHSVFIHRGLVTSGHYWIYIYDFKRSMWRKYNDGYVTEVKDPQKEIYDAEDSSRPATPYFLVYVRDERKEDLVDAVCRDVDVESGERINTEGKEGSQDTVMGEIWDTDSGTCEMIEWPGGGEGLNSMADSKRAGSKVNGQWARNESEEEAHDPNIEW